MYYGQGSISAFLSKGVIWGVFFQRVGASFISM